MQIDNYKLELRPATMADLPRLVSLAAELGYLTSETVMGLSLRAANRGGDAVWVAVGAGEVVGWTHVGSISSLVDEPAARLLALVVTETWRGRGVGRALVARAEAWAVEQGRARLVVTSNAARVGAHEFYPRLGFTRTKTQHVYTKMLAGRETMRRGELEPEVRAGRLWHVSESSDIARFEPRPPPSLDVGVKGDAVWAITDGLLHNYLLPRDCPRVTFYPTAATTAEDRARLLGPDEGPGAARAVVVIEAAWWARVRAERLWCYALPTATFHEVDAGAGYGVSREPVSPTEIFEVEDVVAAIAARGVELRVVRSLWPWRDAVVGSTLAFSCIRLRNAARRDV